MAALTLLALYTIFKRPKEILFSILRFLASPTGRGWIAQLILAPIWIPIYFLDKHYKWGIYNTKEANVLDEPYDYQSTFKLDFSPFRKYILGNGADVEQLKDSITECLSSAPEFDEGDITILAAGESVVIEVNESLSFFSYGYILQWLTSNLEVDFIGFSRHDSNDDLSFQIACDKTGMHTNGLTGKTTKGTRFAVNLLDTAEPPTYLLINSRLKLDLERPWTELEKQLKSALDIK